MVDLLEGKSITVRAWDTSFNTQPEDVTWNVLGMMNNSVSIVVAYLDCVVLVSIWWSPW